MILRVFHVTVHDGMASEFEKFFRTIALPLVRNQDGLMSVVAGKSREDAQYFLYDNGLGECRRP